MASYWFGTSQWQLPNEVDYRKLQALFARVAVEKHQHGELEKSHHQLVSTYSELNRQEREKPHTDAQAQEADFTEIPHAADTKEPASDKRKERIRKEEAQEVTVTWSDKKPGFSLRKGVAGAVKGWLRQQIDEEQIFTLPASNLVPGRRIRLRIRRGFSNDLVTVEITLPPDFVPGKPVRLRGLGKRVGPWQGDLYLKLNSQ